MTKDREMLEANEMTKNRKEPEGNEMTRNSRYQRAAQDTLGLPRSSMGLTLLGMLAGLCAWAVLGLGCEKGTQVGESNILVVATDHCVTVSDCQAKYGPDERLVCIAEECSVVGPAGGQIDGLPALPGTSDPGGKTQAQPIYPCDRDACWARGGACLVDLTPTCAGCEGRLPNVCVSPAQKCVEGWGADACELPPEGWVSPLANGDVGTTSSSDMCSGDVGPDPPPQPCTR